MSVKTLIITVLPESEAKAVRVVFNLKGLADESDEYPVYYYSGGHIAISCIINKGNTNAGTAMGYLIDKYKPQNAILVGTCAGRPDKTNIGDVVFSQLGVFDYGQSSLLPGKERRFESVGSPGNLAKGLSFLKSDPELEDNWRSMVFKAAQKLNAKTPEEIKPQLWGKAIASGNQIIDERSMKVLTDANEHIYAADQDSVGFAASCKAKHVDWVAVRGVSDCGDRKTRKGYAEYATITAATIVKLFLDISEEGSHKPMTFGSSGAGIINCPPSLGCTHIWVPSHGHEDAENEHRNQAKLTAIKTSTGATIRLLAQTGYSFLNNRGTFYKAIRQHLEDDGEFRIVLMDPSVDNILCTDDENAEIHAKYQMALNGYSTLKNDFGPRIRLKTVRMNLPATIFFTNTLCFYEPYVHITAQRERFLFVAFEMLFDKSISPHGYNLMMEYFQALYDNGTEFPKREGKR